MQFEKNVRKSAFPQFARSREKRSEIARAFSVFPLLIAERVCFNRGVNSARPMSSEETKNSDVAPAERRSRVRLRMRPPAKDSFSAFVYGCVALLLIGEFVALFWLDIFG